MCTKKVSYDALLKMYPDLILPSIGADRIGYMSPAMRSVRKQASRSGHAVTDAVPVDKIFVELENLSVVDEGKSGQGPMLRFLKCLLPKKLAKILPVLLKLLLVFAKI
jgi:hypothetical protein